MIMKNYKHSSTFEEFISNVYSPVQTMSPFQQPYNKNVSGISLYCITVCMCILYKKIYSF